MKLTIAHNKTQPEAIAAADRAVDDVLKAIQNSPLEVTDLVKTWDGPVCQFSLTAALGFMKNPVTGTVAVAPGEIAIELELGFLTKFMPEEKVKERLEGRVKALLT